MIPFFRKIRERLLSDRRLGKYLLYAAGEILLVVIGILIALYLDEQRDVREDRRQEQVYLQRFHRELELNLTDLDRVVSQSDSLVGRIDSLLSLKFGEIPPVSGRTFNRLGIGVVDYLIFQSTEASVEDLIGSGQLEIIRDEGIREAIATWHTGLMPIRSLELDHKKAFNDLLEYYKLHVEMFRIMRDQQIVDDAAQSKLLSDPVYFNTLTYHAIPLELLNREYRKKREEFRGLKSRVASQLDTSF